MKFLILTCLLGFAAASFLEEASLAADDAVSAMFDGMSRSGSLRVALGMPEAYELDEVEDDIKTELGKILKEQLDHVLEKIKDHIDHGKNVAKELWNKVKELKNQLEDMHEDMGNKAKDVLKNILEKVKNKGKELWEKIKEILGISGKRSLYSLQNEISRLDSRDLLEKIKEKIMDNETIQKIREYIKNFVTNNPILLKLKEMFLKLKDVDLKELLRILFNHDIRGSRSIKDFWQKIKDFFDEKHILIKEKFTKFGEWLKETWDNGWDKIKDKHEVFKEIAKKVIDQVQVIGKDVLEQAWEVLEPHKKEIGEFLWNKFVEIVKEKIGEIGY